MVACFHKHVVYVSNFRTCAPHINRFTSDSTLFSIHELAIAHTAWMVLDGFDLDFSFALSLSFFGLFMSWECGKHARKMSTTNQRNSKTLTHRVPHTNHVRKGATRRLHIHTPNTFIKMNNGIQNENNIYYKCWHPHRTAVMDRIKMWICVSARAFPRSLIRTLARDRVEFIVRQYVCGVWVYTSLGTIMGFSNFIDREACWLTTPRNTHITHYTSSHTLGEKETIRSVLTETPHIQERERQVLRKEKHSVPNTTYITQTKNRCVLYATDYYY